MMHQFMKIQRRPETACVEGPPLAQQAKREVVEGQDMHIDQREAPFHAQEALHAIAQMIRRYDNREGFKRILKFEAAEVGDEG
jgi:hypothetical protein